MEIRIELNRLRVQTVFLYLEEQTTVYLKRDNLSFRDLQSTECFNTSNIIYESWYKGGIIHVK